MQECFHCQVMDYICKQIKVQKFTVSNDTNHTAAFSLQTHVKMMDMSFIGSFSAH